MKKSNYLIFSIILVILSVYLYQNYIYYRIPHNPIAKYSSKDPISFSIEKIFPNGESSIIFTKKNSKYNKKILEYFSNLELIPMKNKTVYNMNISVEQIYFIGFLEFDFSKYIIVKDIFIENLNIIYISSNIDGLNSGYYKIINSEFDYEFIYKQIIK